jgi:hypothetical protein
MHITGKIGPIIIENTEENIISMVEIAITNNISVYIYSRLPAINLLQSTEL